MPSVQGEGHLLFVFVSAYIHHSLAHLPQGFAVVGLLWVGGGWNDSNSVMSGHGTAILTASTICYLG